MSTTFRPSRSDVPSEHVEQRNFVSAFRRAYPGVLIFAVPNGGRRSKFEAHRLSLEGVVPGVPDLFIPEARLFVEMKRQKGGALSQAQRDMIPRLESAGYSVVVAKGCEDALSIIQSYLGEQNL